MNILSKLLYRKKEPRPHELIRPYKVRAEEAILRNDLNRAIAFLNCGIRLAPDYLGLYLQRAQIQQYGLNNCTQALEDYRFILRKLESTPDHILVCKCKEAMKDMMSQ